MATSKMAVPNALMPQHKRLAMGQPVNGMGTPPGGVMMKKGGKVEKKAEMKKGGKVAKKK